MTTVASSAISDEAGVPVIVSLPVPEIHGGNTVDEQLSWRSVK